MDIKVDEREVEGRKGLEFEDTGKDKLGGFDASEESDDEACERKGMGAECEDGVLRTEGRESSAHRLSRGSRSALQRHLSF